MNALAIIVAAGSGTRFGAKKQFLEVDGKPLYYYSIKAFKPYAEGIFLVVPKEDRTSVDPYGAMLVAGGKQRYNSVYNAIKAINAIKTVKAMENMTDVHVTNDTIVMIHDGARPCITSDVIERVMKDAEQYGAAVATVPVTDTIRTIDGDLMDRNKLRAMQTPQAFKYGILKESFDKLMSLPEEAIDNLHITDDVQVVSQMSGINAHMSEGNPLNIKVTTPGDIQNLHIS